MYLGIDSSTQSLSGMLIDPQTGSIAAEESIHFGSELPQFSSPSGFIPSGQDGEVHADPRMWMEALDLLMSRLQQKTDLSKVKAIGGSGQQHGSVYVDASFADRLRNLSIDAGLSAQLSASLARATSPIWMDTSTTLQCREMAAAVGGDAQVCRLTGSIAIERFTGSQIRKFSQVDPAGYEKTDRVHLVSSFICSLFAGTHAAIDFGDGAGMNLMNLASCQWDQSMLEATAPELAKKLPCSPHTITVWPSWLIRPELILFWLEIRLRM